MAIGTFIHLELADRCNFKCVFCPPDNRSNALFDYDKFIAVMDVASNTSIHGVWYNTIQLNGNGEPFLYPRLFEAVIEAKKRFPYVEFITNGFLMTENKIEELLNTGIDSINFSLTGVIPEIYSKFQGSGIPYEQAEKQLIRVVNNVKMLAKKRDEMGKKTYIRLRYIKNKESENHLKDFIKYWKNTGVNDVFVTSLWDFKRAKKQNATYKVLRCSNAPRRYHVSANGEVFPCACNYDMERNFMGNINKTEFESIINSDLFLNEKKARMSSDLGIVPKSCLTCENRCLRVLSEEIKNKRQIIFLKKPFKTFVYKLFGPAVIIFERITRYKLFYNLYLLYLRRSSLKTRRKFLKRNSK